MPVIRNLDPALEPRALGRNVVRIVESDQSRPIRRMKRERVGQAMRSVRRRIDAHDFEFEPVALLEMMDAPIECEQELQVMVRRAPSHII